MKKTTCQDLAGACDQEITGNTPDEMAENAKKHAIKMLMANDQAHKDAVQKMIKMSPAEQQKFFTDFKNRFDSLPEVE